jgi:hypothetical protein
MTTRAETGWWGWLACCAWASLVSVLASGCAFPLFNVEERATPKTLAYVHRRAATDDAPPKRVREPQPVSASRAARSSTPALGPRKTSVLDPRPREVQAPAPKGSCYGRLDRAGVRFDRVGKGASGVRWPVRLTGPVRGVTFENLDNSQLYAVIDCRLALSLVDWARDLRRARVRKVEYYSVYRPGARVGGDGAISGHAHALAIDVARFELDSGAVLDVLSDWEERERGGAPCPLRRDEASASRLLRGVTCKAVDRKLFQVVLTPHYDKAHRNHVHLEVKPDVDWLFVK